MRVQRAVDALRKEINAKRAPHILTALVETGEVNSLSGIYRFLRGDGVTLETVLGIERGWAKLKLRA